MRFFLAANNFPFWKAWDTTSSVSLSSPDILMGVMCEAFVAWMRIPRKRRRRPAASDYPDITFNVHPTAEVLSQKRSAWVFDRLDVRHSSAIQLRTIPARLVLLMVRLPSFNMSFTFCGHSYFHMIGLSYLGQISRLPPWRFYKYLSTQYNVVSCSTADGSERCVFPYILSSPLNLGDIVLGRVWCSTTGLCPSARLV